MNDEETVNRIIELESKIIEARELLKSAGISSRTRDYWGTMHANVLALTNELAKKGGFR